MEIRKNTSSCLPLLKHGTLALYFFFLYEWLFYLTKPSFLTGSSWLESVAVLILTSGLIILPWVLAQLLLCVLSNFYSPALRLLPLFYALPLAALAFSVLDDCAHTYLGWGSLYLSGPARILAAAVLCSLVLALYLSAWKRRREKLSFLGKLTTVVACLLLPLSSLALIAYQYGTPRSLLLPDTVLSKNSPSTRHPDIYIIGTDALAASHMSLYGYERDTTPFLRRWSAELLVFENAFANTASSTGSILAMLSGREPAETRVVHYPDILHWPQSHQHFLSILRTEGYHMVEASMRYYADSFDVNLRDGFHKANRRDLTSFPYTAADAFPQLSSSRLFYFLLEVHQRLSNRLLHLFGIVPGERWYELIVNPTVYFGYDKSLFAQVREFIENTDSPVFAHMHLLSTHPPRYLVEQQHFSKGQVQSEDKMIDFYDDAILGFDRMLEEFIAYLRDSGRLSRSVILIYSDHDSTPTINVRLPLLWYFPDQLHRGRVSTNAQLIDVAPTLLDILNLPKPEYMKGKSLLTLNEDDLSRPIISIQARNPSVKNYRREPYGSFELIGAIFCSTAYALELDSQTLTKKTIGEDSARCDLEEVPNSEQAYSFIRKYLSDHGFQNN